MGQRFDKDVFDKACLAKLPSPVLLLPFIFDGIITISFYFTIETITQVTSKATTVSCSWCRVQSNPHCVNLKPMSRGKTLAKNIVLWKPKCFNDDERQTITKASTKVLSKN